MCGDTPLPPPPPPSPHPPLQWLATTSVAFAEKWTRKMATAVQHASSGLHPDNDIMVVSEWSPPWAHSSPPHPGGLTHCSWLHTEHSAPAPPSTT
jgi:hypothetical protein